jgi:heptosyltransferase II
LKLGALGDIVMASTMIGAIHHRWPDSRITWICGESCAPLVRALRGVDEVVEVADKALFGAGLRGKVKAVVQAWKRMPRGKVDLLLIGNPDLRYRLLPLFLRAGETRVLDRSQLWQGRWHGDEYARLIHGINGPDAPQSAIAQPRLDQPAASRDPALVVLIPGGARNYARVSDVRRWPVESYAALAGKLLDAGYKVAISGGPTDDWVRPAFSALAVEDWVGKTSIPQFLHNCSRAALVVTHDTGPMHMAHLARTPVLALFGPTSPFSFSMPAQRGNAIWGGQNLPCRPCYDGREFAACANNLCMKQIAVAEVLARALRMLAPEGKAAEVRNG